MLLRRTHRRCYLCVAASPRWVWGSGSGPSLGGGRTRDGGPRQGEGCAASPEGGGRRRGVVTLLPLRRLGVLCEGVGEMRRWRRLHTARRRLRSIWVGGVRSIWYQENLPIVRIFSFGSDPVQLDLKPNTHENWVEPIPTQSVPLSNTRLLSLVFIKN
jgi:hypothetical protein